jgi:DNA polymerase-3 subunit gamma/tau
VDFVTDKETGWLVRPDDAKRLAEKINFEVTLLKAVEASRSRAIDSLIKELATLADEAAVTESTAPESEKKKG